MSKKEKKAKQKPSKLEKFFKKLRFFVKHVVSVFYPFELHGNLTIYEDTPLICTGNHYSYLDVIFPFFVTDQPIHFIAKQELNDNGGLMKWFVNKCECIFVKRDGSDVKAIKDSMRILKAGGVINIFPEGTRNHSYKELLPFKSGAAALSIKTQTPIVPIVKVTRLKPFRKSHVIIGDPIEFKQYYGKKVTKEQIDECDNTLREAMTNMRLAFLDKHPIKLKSDKV